ncbi:uncharacterized protein LOC128716372 [Anopheles marshallii]|uniref:uncharacterized protein LOC128716372 n=1 Tax=Anopheles marshallii TaxID=1521116 RepID=UPI00237C3ED4|nr:uncharacterized protein LOC128716372 [Anopheles marshallii]
MDCVAKRKPTDVISDVGSSVYSQSVHASRKEYQQRLRKPDKHIAFRLVRYFTFGGILQAIAEATGIPRDTLVKGGASQLQDQSSGCGDEIHAAHVIRIGSINGELKTKNESLHRALENYVGHTQNVPRKVNFWSGIGGAIDQYQSNKLSALATIHFTGTLSDNRDIIVQLQATFRAIVDEYVLKERNGESREIFEKVKETIDLVEDNMLFGNGTAGYAMVQNGTFLQRYNRHG